MLRVSVFCLKQLFLNVIESEKIIYVLANYCRFENLSFGSEERSLFKCKHVAVAKLIRCQKQPHFRSFEWRGFLYLNQVKVQSFKKWIFSNFLHKTLLFRKVLLRQKKKSIISKLLHFIF